MQIERYYFNQAQAYIRETLVLPKPKVPKKALAFMQDMLGESKNSKQAVPDVIYPLVECIHANVVTRNRTYYTVDGLIGSSTAVDESGVTSPTGYLSWKVPYDTPWIRDHNTNGGCMGGEGSEVFGRTIEAWWTADTNGGGHVAAIPMICDPYAIERILDGRWNTVSIGSSTESVKCSICEAELLTGSCEHEKGMKYTPEGSDLEQLCYWIIGPIRNRETSFVLVPSDYKAGVKKADVGKDKLSVYAGSPRREFIFDLADPKRSNLLESSDPSISEHAIALLENSKEAYQDYHNTRTIFVFESVDEAKLSTKARKGLPSSAFALVYVDKKTGKTVRRFPIHDLAHATAALRMLGRAKGLTPAQRAMIKRKAQAAVKRFGGGKKKEFSDAECKEIEVLIADFREDDDSTDEPVRIDVDHENYPVLFGVIEDLEEELDEANERIEQLELEVEGLKATLRDAGKAKSETEETTVAEETTKDTVTEEEETEKTESQTEEQAEQASEEQTEETITETRTVEQYQELLQEAETANESLSEALTTTLASAIASFQIVLQRAEAKNKTREQLVERLSTRKLDYLQGVFEDMLEAVESPVINAEGIESAKDPVERDEEVHEGQEQVDEKTAVEVSTVSERAAKKADADFEQFLAQVRK